MNTPTSLEQIAAVENWYERRARLSRFGFVSLSIAQLLCPFSISIIALMPASSWHKYILVSLGGVTGLMALLAQLGQVERNWLWYRATREKLRQERLLFTGKAGPYKDVSEPEPLFVERVCAVLATDVEKWISNRAVSSKSIDSIVSRSKHLPWKVDE